MVVERGGRLSAAVAATLLRHYGATVIRFEDDADARCRIRLPGISIRWHAHGKQIVAADADPLARAAQWEALVRSADVVIQSIDVDAAHTVETPPASSPVSGATNRPPPTATGRLMSGVCRHCAV